MDTGLRLRRRLRFADSAAQGVVMMMYCGRAFLRSRRRGNKSSAKGQSADERAEAEGCSVIHLFPPFSCAAGDSEYRYNPTQDF